MRVSWKYAVFCVVLALLAWGIYSAGGTDDMSGSLAVGMTADKVLIEKGKRSLTLMKGNEVLKRYRISLGGNPVGDKEREGDQRTPEGVYRIDYRNEKSKFHLALHISYPDKDDVERARAGGYSPGGDIMIHGLPNGLGWGGKLYLRSDWTLGCIAVTNQDMDEIWRVVPDGTKVEIVP